MDETNAVDDGWEAPPEDPTVSAHPEHAARANRRDDWLVNTSGQDVVHMTTHEIIVALQSERLTERALVWRSGMPEWLELVQVPALRLVAQRAASARDRKDQERDPPGPRPSSAPMGPPRSQSPSSAHYVAPHAPAPRVTQPPAQAATAEASIPERVSARRKTQAPVARRTLPGVGGNRAVGNSEVTLASSMGKERAPGDTDVIAVYERPAPTLAFSDSAAREWHASPQRHESPKPAPSPSAAQSRETLPPPSRASGRQSLSPAARKIPTLTPAATSVPPVVASRPPASEGKSGLWNDVSMVAAGQLRAVRAASLRIAIFASLASAVAASALTLFLVTRSKSPSLPLQAGLGLTANLAARPAAAVAPRAKPAEPAPVALPAPPNSATAEADAVASEEKQVPAVKRQAVQAAKPKTRPVRKLAKRVAPKPVAPEAPASAKPPTATFDNPYADEPVEDVEAVAETSESTPSGDAISPSATKVAAEEKDSSAIKAPSGTDESSKPTPEF